MRISFKSMDVAWEQNALHNTPTCLWESSKKPTLYL